MPEDPKPAEKCPYCFYESLDHKCIGWTIRDYRPAVGAFICCKCKMGFEGKLEFTLPHDKEDEL